MCPDQSGRMCVLENHPFVIAIDNDLLALVRLLSSLKIDCMPQILDSFQNVADGLINHLQGACGQ